MEKKKKISFGSLLFSICQSPDVSNETMQDIAHIFNFRSGFPICRGDNSGAAAIGWQFHPLPTFGAPEKEYPKTYNAQSQTPNLMWHYFSFTSLLQTITKHLVMF